MPLPLAPLVPLALRLGAVAAIGLVAKKVIVSRTFVGRTDQRAEDAMDDLGDGLSAHKPKDAPGQSNAGLRLRRTIRFRGKTYEFDASALARIRIKEIE